MHDQVKKLSSFGFKATFGGPEQDQFKNFAGSIAGHRVRECDICLLISQA